QRTIRPMVMAIIISTKVMPAARRRRKGSLVHVILQSISGDEGGDFPLARELARCPVYIDGDFFQIRTIRDARRRIRDTDRAVINRSACDTPLHEIWRLEIRGNEAVG